MLNTSFITQSLFAAIATLACSATAVAGMFPETKDKNDGIIQIGGGAQYFTQTNNLPELSDLPQFTDFLTPADPNNQWGYTLNAGYIFPQHKNDIQANFTNVHATSDNNFNNVILPRQVINSAIDADFKYLDADITFGHYIKRHQHLMYRLGYGIEYTQIEQNGTDHLSITAQSQRGNGKINTENKFWGVGPKLTFDGQYDILKYFGLVGGIGVSALYGETNSTFQISVSNTRDAIPSIDQKDSRIVFGIDAKLGLRFTYLPTDDYGVNLEAGYQGNTLFNALEGDFTALNTQFLATQISFSQNEHYSNYGPYVNFSVDFM